MNRRISMAAFPLMAIVATMSLLISSCQKKDPSLGALPVPSFTSIALTPTSDSTAQNVELINTTPTPGIAIWNIPGLGTFKGDTVKVAFVFAGDYPVQLLIAGQGGIDSTMQNVTIAADNPYAVGPTTLLGVLTGAGLGKTQRTWIPERVVNSVIVYGAFDANGNYSGALDSYSLCLSQIDGGGGAWYAFGPADIATNGTGRDGYLDDQYTFTFGKVGQFIYNDNNTVYLDKGGSGWTAALAAPWNKTLGTTSSTDLYNTFPALKPWASSTFSYSISPAPSGVMQLGQLTVKGVGAHIGMMDKTNSGDEITPTVTSVTYDVLRIATGLEDANTHTKYDQIILGVSEPGLVWTFMFRSDE